MPASTSDPTLDRRRACGLVWLCLALAVLAGAAWWWRAGRPVSLPDAPTARIACVSYAPFRMPGETPYNPEAVVDPQRIDADLRALSQRFDCVRTYSQAHGLDAVPAIAERYGMKVIMGIWLSSDPVANEHEVRRGIATARAHPQALRGIVVGNEVLLRGELRPDALAAYIRRVRGAVSVPVTYADVWEYWLKYRELAGSVDYLTIHILPYWEDDPVPPEHAVEHVAAVYEHVRQAFPGMRVMIGETGWPSAGRPRHATSATLVNEARYLREFLRYAGTVDMPYNVIEAFDQPWKRAQEGTVGGYWGIFDVQARPKFAMQGPVVEIPQWWLGWLAGAAGAALFLLMGGWRRQRPPHRAALALLLAGAASGLALAWQARQLAYACDNLWEWTVSVSACVCALLTALGLARRMVGLLCEAGDAPVSANWRWLRSAWLFALIYYDMLMVWDGRYRDFPLGLFELPCVGYLLLGWLGGRAAAAIPTVEERFLAVVGVLLGATTLVQEAALNPSAWLWLGLNLAMGLAVGRGWWRGRRLLTQQA